MNNRGPVNSDSQNAPVYPGAFENPFHSLPRIFCCCVYAEMMMLLISASSARIDGMKLSGGWAFNCAVMFA
jgi:hypothetical protein